MKAVATLAMLGLATLAQAQEAKFPVALVHYGKDAVGLQLKNRLTDEISRNAGLKLGSLQEAFLVIDITTIAADEPVASAFSVVYMTADPRTDLLVYNTSTMGIVSERQVEGIAREIARELTTRAERSKDQRLDLAKRTCRE